MTIHMLLCVLRWEASGVLRSRIKRIERIQNLRLWTKFNLRKA